MGRKSFVDACRRLHREGQVVYGTGTSVACQDLMALVGSFFPDAHLDAEAMAALAMAGYTELGFDVVMPLFSVCHEAAALGCHVDWGGPDAMPEAGRPIHDIHDVIRLPRGFLAHSSCRTPLQAIGLLKERLGDAAAVCGKVFGGWTLSYHVFGVEQFLMNTLDEPDNVRRILDQFLPVTLAFARAQIDAGADCLLLADHATRDLCAPHAYADFLQDHHSRIAAELDVPIILHICGDTSDRIGMIAQTALDAFHWDTKTGQPEHVRQLAGDRLALMGGVSNLKLLGATPPQVAAQAAAAARAGIDIVGPECAIPLRTPLVNLKAVAAAS